MCHVIHLFTTGNWVYMWAFHSLTAPIPKRLAALWRALVQHGGLKVSVYRLALARTQVLYIAMSDHLGLVCLVDMLAGVDSGVMIYH